MGFFKRTRSDARTPAQGPSLDFTEADLPRLEAVLDDFLGSVGTPRFEVAVQHLARAGGIDVDRIEWALTRGADAMHRPWHWLLLGAQAARSANRGDLLIKASGVVSFWQMAIAPTLTPADWLAMGLSTCPTDVETAIHQLALDSSIDLPDDAVLATDAQGDSMTIGLVRESARQRISSSP